jgi:hypothetical protein
MKSLLTILMASAILVGCGGGGDDEEVVSDCKTTPEHCAHKPQGI